MSVKNFVDLAHLQRRLDALQGLPRRGALRLQLRAGSGEACTFCRQAIAATELEHAVLIEHPDSVGTLVQLPLRFHAWCYRVWDRVVGDPARRKMKA
jgi:hypothetical protein